MAGPYDLSFLNGVTFDADHTGKFATGYFAVNDPRMGYNGFGHYGSPVIYGTKYSGSVTLNLLDNNRYIASYTDGNGYYHSAILGLFEFNGFTWSIQGFGEDGRSILIVKDTGGSSPHAIAPMGNPDTAIVLSLDALPHYANASDLPNVGSGHGYGFDSAPAHGSTFFSALCFAEGTRIETPEGPVAVEDLTEGQSVLTASGAVRPVKWIGQMLSRPDRHPRPWEVQPVRVTAHAFGPSLPAHDVRLSPGHAVLVDGVLVPVGSLINGATIVQETVETVRYFHVELDSHDVLLAEGLPCESYLDDGNRATFNNADGHADLHGRLDPKSWEDACAPLVAAGPQLTELQQRLHDRAAELGWVKSEAADLAIEADGVRIAPVHASGNRYWFAVPAAETLTLRSNHGVLAHLIPGLGDGRRLGVAVAELRIDGTALDLADNAFGQGFYPVEQHEALGWRWTDGAALLNQALPIPAMVEVTLVMVAPSWVRPVPALRAVA